MAPATPDMEILMTFRVHQEGKYHVAQAVELDVSSFGKSVEEAVEALADATTTYLEALDQEGALEEVLKEKEIPIGRPGWSSVRVEVELYTPRELVSRWPVPLRRAQPHGEPTALVGGA